MRVQMNANPREHFIELPRQLVLDRLSQQLLFGQDPLLRKLTEIIILRLKMGDSDIVNVAGLKFLMITSCLSLGRYADLALKMIRVLIESLKTINHPDARSFYEAILREKFGLEEINVYFGKKWRKP